MQLFVECQYTQSGVALGHEHDGCTGRQRRTHCQCERRPGHGGCGHVLPDLLDQEYHVPGSISVSTRACHLLGIVCSVVRAKAGFDSPPGRILFALVFVTQSLHHMLFNTYEITPLRTESIDKTGVVFFSNDPSTPSTDPLHHKAHPSESMFSSNVHLIKGRTWITLLIVQFECHLVTGW